MESTQTIFEGGIMGFQTFCSASERLSRLINETREAVGVEIEVGFSTLAKALTRDKGRIFACGNGGSAASSQHFTAELVSRYKKERGPLPALSLTTDTSALTAIGNDYGYEHVFARQLRGLGREGDVLVAFSTSGRSPNVLKAIEAARELKMAVIFLTGASCASIGDSDGRICVIAIPSQETARIQEVHDLIMHSWCEALDPLFNETT